MVVFCQRRVCIFTMIIAKQVTGRFSCLTEGLRSLLLLMAFIVLFNPGTAFSQVQPVVSQLIGVKHSILNQFGEPLNGTDPFAHQQGYVSVQGDLIQILQTSSNIYPPDIHGNPDPRNTVIGTSRVGLGVSPALSRSGRFAHMLSPRPSGNTKIFVRVFNAPTLEEATFYGDSQVFSVSANSNSLFMVDVDATDQPLDPADDDGDGLNNSWERSYGTDPYMSDSDGDGISDLDEIIAGTDPLNEDSFPKFTAIQLDGADYIRVEWNPSVSGRTYSVFHRETLSLDSDDMYPVGMMESTGEFNFMAIPKVLLTNDGVFIFRISQ